MADTDEPRAVSELLAEARDRLARRPAIEDGDELAPASLAQVRQQGVDELRQARWGAVIPSRFMWATLDDFADQPDAHKLLTEWVAIRGPVPNLVMLGEVGTGKTHAAVAACRAAHDHGQEVRFLPVVELLDQLRPGGPEHAYESLADVDRLIVDDMGSERPTDWTSERMGALINRRWMEERPTIATTNLEPKELEAALGVRTYSRLVGSDAVVVRLGGPDRRRKR